MNNREMNNRDMNWINRLSIFGLGTVFGIAVCIAIFIYTDRFSSPQVFVNVVNASGYKLVEIKIESNTGYLIHNLLKKDEEIVLPLFVRDKGAYSISVKLENGTVLKGGLDSVESGYATKELIQKDRIESRIVSYY